MMRLAVSLLVAAALLAAPAAASTPTLFATVGPGFAIAFHDKDGKAVSHLEPGVYTIQIDDRSPEHNFHLTGAGVDMATDVPEVGQVIWDVTFADGIYRFVCDAHVSTMKGSFAVGSASLPSPPQNLTASVGPGAKIFFNRSAKAGKAVIAVRDRSAADNFHLTGPGVNRKTGVKFKGTVSWTVTLQSGTYAFRSDAHARRLKGTTTVS